MPTGEADFGCEYSYYVYLGKYLAAICTALLQLSIHKTDKYLNRIRLSEEIARKAKIQHFYDNKFLDGMLYDSGILAKRLT